MDVTGPTTVTDVAEVLTSTLGIDGQPLDASTPLFGSLPELDSMAVVELIAALEGRFDVEFDEEEVTEAVFETLGSLAALVDAKRAGGSGP
jgi:acyl carrier protein